MALLPPPLLLPLSQASGVLQHRNQSLYQHHSSQPDGLSSRPLQSSSCERGHSRSSTIKEGHSRNSFFDLGPELPQVNSYRPLLHDDDDGDDDVFVDDDAEYSLPSLHDHDSEHDVVDDANGSSIGGAHGVTLCNPQDKCRISLHIRRHEVATSLSSTSSSNDWAHVGDLFSHPLRQHKVVDGKLSSSNPLNVPLLRTLCKQGRLERAVDILCGTHTSLPSSIYVSLLQACSGKRSLAQAKRVYAHLAHYNPNKLDDLGGHLVVTLARCGAIADARLVSSRLPRRTVFSWTAIISAYVERGKAQEALKVYQSMQEDGVEANGHTFSSLFKACGSIADLKLGRKLHLEARERGFSTDIFIGSTLVSMYSKCGSIAEAEGVFTMMSQRDTVVWNAMLAAYVEHGQEEKVIRLYRQMREEHVTVDNYTLMFVLEACRNLADDMCSLGEQISNKVIFIEIGWAVFANALAKGFALDDFVRTALLTMLGKCGAIAAAEHLFSTMSPRSIVLWTAMLSAYTEQGQAKMVLQMFKELQVQGLSPDPQAFVVALKACALLAERTEMKGQAFEIGQALHADACKKGYVSNVLVSTALITMYGKCGAVEEAEIVFSTLATYDDVSWTALLSAFVEYGQGAKALLIYKEIRTRIAANEVTLVCILQACLERGSLEMCNCIHFDIVSSGYDQVGFLAATLIHAYASCASIEDAQAVFDRLSNPDVAPWNACITSHTGETSVDMFEKMKLACIEPNESTFTSVLSACSHAGLVVKGVEYFDCISKSYGICPSLMHYGSMVGLLGRAGDFERVANMLQRMPMQADMTIWLGLLRACHTHGNMELALQAFDSALRLQYDHGAPYVLMSNIYADTGLEKCGIAGSVLKRRRKTQEVLDKFPL